MGNETVQAEPALQGENIPQFRMRTAHFFLLTTVCAIVGTIRLSWIDWNEVPIEVLGFFKLQVGIFSLLFGAAITALLILLGRRWRFGRSELQFPGHWLLVFLAIVALIRGVTGALLEVFRHYSDSSNIGFEAWNLEKLMLCSAAGITCFIFSWLIPGNFCWKSILAIPGVILLALVPQHVLVLQGTWRPWFSLAHVYASLGVSAAIVPLLLFACISDFRQQLQRDWLHWSGVFVVAIAAVTEFCSASYWLWSW